MVTLYSPWGITGNSQDTVVGLTTSEDHKERSDVFRTPC